MKEFIAALRKAEQQFIPTINEALDEIAEIAQQKAKSTTLFGGSATGGLRGSINIHKNGSFSRMVLAEKDYAGYVEYGNNQKGPYIYPIKAKALHFWINGREIFAKKVRSHGPLPFMNDAKEYTIKKIPGILAKHLGKIL
jgi:hypothetical protein